jgi:hypothetical protein
MSFNCGNEIKFIPCCCYFQLKDGCIWLPFCGFYKEKEHDEFSREVTTGCLGFYLTSLDSEYYVSSPNAFYSPIFCFKKSENDIFVISPFFCFQYNDKKNETVVSPFCCGYINYKEYIYNRNSYDYCISPCYCSYPKTSKTYIVGISQDSTLNKYILEKKLRYQNKITFVEIIPFFEISSKDYFNGPQIQNMDDYHIEKQMNSDIQSFLKETLEKANKTLFDNNLVSLILGY